MFFPFWLFQITDYYADMPGPVVRGATVASATVAGATATGADGGL